MDIEFEFKSYCSTSNLLDFLLITFKPTKIEHYKSAVTEEHVFKMYGAEAVSPSYLEKELQEFHLRNSQIGDILFKVERIRYSAKEKRKMESIITYGKIFGANKK